jgi:hypothetical protein
MANLKMTFKDPDGVYDCLRDYVTDEVKSITQDEDEQEMLIDKRMEKYKDKLKKWIDCGEYLEVEFDLENMTAKVMEN